MPKQKSREQKSVRRFAAAVNPLSESPTGLPTVGSSSIAISRPIVASASSAIWPKNSNRVNHSYKLLSDNLHSLYGQRHCMRYLTMIFVQMVSTN